MARPGPSPALRTHGPEAGGGSHARPRAGRPGGRHEAQVADGSILQAAVHRHRRAPGHGDRRPADGARPGGHGDSGGDRAEKGDDTEVRHDDDEDDAHCSLVIATARSRTIWQRSLPTLAGCERIR